MWPVDPTVFAIPFKLPSEGVEPWVFEDRGKTDGIGGDVTLFFIQDVGQFTRISSSAWSGCLYNLIHYAFHVFLLSYIPSQEDVCNPSKNRCLTLQVPKVPGTNEFSDGSPSATYWFIFGPFRSTYRYWYRQAIYFDPIKIIKVPASSKWPFDHPNGGHLAPEKVT